MTDRYIRHLTLDTGHQRDSYREEVPDDVVALLRPFLDRAVAGERVAVPGDLQPPGCTMIASRGSARALLVTVSGPPYEGRAVHPILPPPPPPLCHIGVAPNSLASAELWRRWIGGERDDRTPSPPWCVVQLLPGLALHPQAAHWLGDLERCLAWAWIR